MRQPRFFHSPAKGVLLVEGFVMAHPGTPWTFSLLLLITALLRPEVQHALLGLGILLAVFWWTWSQLPNWFRKLVWKAFERKKRRQER
jgi:hypothetical protein